VWETNFSTWPLQIGGKNAKETMVNEVYGPARGGFLGRGEIDLSKQILQGRIRGKKRARNEARFLGVCVKQRPFVR